MRGLAGFGRTAFGHRGALAAVIAALAVVSAATAFALTGSHGGPGAARHEATARMTPSRPAAPAPRASQPVRKLARTVKPRPSVSRSAGSATPAQAAQPQQAAAPSPSPQPAEQPQQAAPSPPPQDCYAGPNPTCVPPPPPSWMVHGSYISTPTS
jgi:hypothetical protein